MSKNNIKKISGFTLIEMVVVIAVIGVLMTIAFRGTAAIQGSARDVKRVKNMNDMKAFLEQYYAANGTYPKGTGNAFEVACDPDTDAPAFASSRWGILAANLESEKIVDTATDIANDPTKSNQYCYVVNSTGTSYRLSAIMERKVPTDDVTTDAGNSAGCTSTTNNAYCVKP